MSKIKVKGISRQEKVNVRTPKLMNELTEQAIFLGLAVRYKHHYHENGFLIPQECFACQAIELIENGQREVGMMFDGRSNISELEGRPF